MLFVCPPVWKVSVARSITNQHLIQRKCKINLGCLRILDSTLLNCPIVKNVHYSYTDQDYIEDTNFPSYRESGAGPSAGLEAIIDVSKDDYFSYGETFYGVSVYVHATDSFPLPADKVLVAQPDTDVRMAVKPTVVGSSSDIRGLPLSKRDCFFKNEVHNI